MEQEALQEKIAQKREELRHARRDTDANGNSENSSRTIRSSGKVATRVDGTITGTSDLDGTRTASNGTGTRGTEDSGRSGIEESQRIRPTIRRSSKDHGTSNAVPTTDARTAEDGVTVRLIADDIEKTVPRAKRPYTRHVGEKAVSHAKKTKEPLSHVRAEQAREPFIHALESISEGLDEYIWYRAQDKDKRPIWSDLDDDEKEALATITLRQAEKSKYAAMLVQATIDAGDYLKALGAIVPRAVKTHLTLKNAPKREKQPRAIRINPLAKKQE